MTVDHTSRTGDALGIRTVVNPTRSRPTGGPSSEKARGARVAHTHPEHVKRWFQRRFQAEGESATAQDGVVRIGATADPSGLAVRMLPTVSSAARHRGLRIVRAEIRGTVTVTDPEALAQTLSNGLGQARAYSCGLVLTR
ncbi:type I-E CRISPR-associated protein Cas6/Cse3/CasE [Streptosporangium nondiastaticum]|uniref:Type I-E CRISPR-associated protein Cas6/Cse3/CasE n=1 Tax=Streptosporangium nondiastaticum TaxID=35764 RepID=A0A9X7JMI9_9ACTN|nr:type I-E CRISPR-associated protein Cas6/Cse3/CasE [Streptosporangium nondiastaticum]PSJ26391.1 type I-E CRISPR-associated protein Cas6/Cse3/CasE [Streptosporangium nondiastaticum]